MTNSMHAIIKAFRNIRKRKRSAPRNIAPLWKVPMPAGAAVMMKKKRIGQRKKKR